jgi:hypothetical protein
MNKATRIFLLCLVMGGLTMAAILALLKKNSSGTVSREDSNFAVRDTASIDKIFIANKNGKRFLFKRVSRTWWTLNDTLMVAPTIMQTLLETIHDVDLKRLCTEAEKPNVLKSMATNHDKVEIFVEGKLFRSYYVGGVADEYMGNYFMMTDSDNPVVAHIPGFEGYLSVRYYVDPYLWRSTQLFTGTPKTVTTMIVTDPARNQRTQIEKTPSGYRVDGVAETDQGRVSTYLDPLTTIHCVNFLPFTEKADVDSIARQVPIARIEIYDENPKNNLLMTVYPFLSSKDEWLVVLDKNRMLVNVKRERIKGYLVSNRFFEKAKL